MTLSTLDLDAALILIDFQTGTVDMPWIHPIGAVLEKASALARTFRRLGLPVVLVNVIGGAPGRMAIPRRMKVAPPDWTKLAPQLDPAPTDHLLSKRSWGAFLATDLDDRLRGLGTTQVVIGGVATSIGVESTAREAFGLGYNVALASDAMTDMEPLGHENSLQRIFPRLGEVGTANEIIGLIGARSRTAAGGCG